MTRMTKAQLAWWQGLPVQVTCADCGAVIDKSYAAFGFPTKTDPAGSTSCATGPCAEERHRVYKAARKAALAAESRCEMPECSRRGTMYVGPDRVLLCGTHFKRAKATFYRTSSGMFWLPRATGRDDVVRWADGRAPA